MKQTNEQIEKAQRILKPIGLRIGHTSQEAILNAILALTQEPEEEWPEHGDKIFYPSEISGLCRIASQEWSGSEMQQYTLKMGLLHKTLEEAIAHRDKILSGKVRVVYQEVE